MADRLAVSTWSFHQNMGPVYGTTLNARGEHVFASRYYFPGDLTLLQFPQMVRERYGLRLVELCQMHFQDSDKDYLDELRGRLAESGVSVINVPIDVGNISDPDAAARRQDIENIKKWMDVSAYIGSPCARVNSGHGAEGSTDLGPAIDAYRELAQHAESRGITLLLENHGGLSADPRNMLRMVEGVGSESFRICADFGNWPPAIRYEALELVFPYAVMAHAKALEFDTDGNETVYDFARAMEIAAKAGYQGAYSIEFEGPGDEFEGVAKAVAQLRRYL